MDDCKKFNEASLPKKEDFYSNLKKEDITDAEYLILLVFFQHLNWQIRSLTDFDILLIVEKGIRGEYITLFIEMQKLTTNT